MFLHQAIIGGVTRSVKCKGKNCSGEFAESKSSTTQQPGLLLAAKKRRLTMTSAVWITPTAILKLNNTDVSNAHYVFVGSDEFEPLSLVLRDSTHGRLSFARSKH